MSVVLAGLLCACAGDRGAPESSSTNTRNALVLKNPDTAAWTVGLTAKPGDSIRTLIEVRTAAHDEFERIVFRFAPDGMSGYKVEYVDRPVRTCGSGEVVDLPGDAWLLVRLEPAQAHTDEGEPTVAQRTRDLAYANMKRIKLICDFEAIVEWVIALNSSTPYRTLELDDPPRLVVDVKK